MNTEHSTPIPDSHSNFRSFVNNKWYEHKDEILAWTNQTPKYDSTYYFNQHKWLLKEMFKKENT